MIFQLNLEDMRIFQEKTACVTFFNFSEVGDQFHYCMICPPNEFLQLRNTFIQNRNLINSYFQFLDKKSLF